MRALTILDSWLRFSPEVHPRFIYRAADVIATLDRVCAEVGFPRTIRFDQGSEFITRDLDLWGNLHGERLLGEFERGL